MGLFRIIIVFVVVIIVVVIVVVVVVVVVIVVGKFDYFSTIRKIEERNRLKKKKNTHTN